MRLNVDTKIILGTGTFGSVLHGTLDSHSIAAKENFHRPSLIREAGFVKLCEHPNVVKYFGFVELHDRSYLIMEQALGGTLSRHLGRRKFSASRKASFVRQMCRGLQHIHSNKILHRDIKPENILFRDNNLQHLIIADFGMAEFFDPDPRKPNTHDVVRDRTYSFESDVYLLGLLAWQLFVDKFRVDRTTAGDKILDAAKAGDGFGREVFPKVEWEIAIVTSVSRTPANRPSLTAMYEAFQG